MRPLRGVRSREFGNWNSIWKRFWRLSQTGVFEAFFEALATMSGTAHLVQMFDSTVVRAHAGPTTTTAIMHNAATAFLRKLLERFTMRTHFLNGGPAKARYPRIRFSSALP
jgi:hypothetical protein